MNYTIGFLYIDIEQINIKLTISVSHILHLFPKCWSE
jgi:hypothetical protein